MIEVCGYLNGGAELDGVLSAYYLVSVVAGAIVIPAWRAMTAARGELQVLPLR